MAADAKELRSRLEFAVGEGAFEKKPSSHLLLTIKAPPNSARQKSSEESLQSEASLRSSQPTSRTPRSTRTARALNRKEGKKEEVEAEGRRKEIGDEDLPQHKPLLNQRIGWLLRGGCHTDVVFRVGPEEGVSLEAHRLILASASCLFDQLLYADTSSVERTQDGKRILHEPHSSLIPFQVFLTSIYTNQIPLGLSLSMALEVLYAAKKYEVVFVQALVMEHVAAAVTTVNVIEALSISTKLLELTVIIPACWKIMEEETGQVLEHHLESIEAHTLGRILDRDVLNMTEVEIFQYLVRWAVVQCKKRGLKWTGRRKREMLEPLLKHVRFTTMDAESIREVIGPARVLDPREISAILGHINGPEHLKLQLPYKQTPRRIPFSKQVELVVGETVSLEGLFSELIMDYGTDTDVPSCPHKKKIQKKGGHKWRGVKRAPLSGR